ncbi:MAG TPA: ATP-grasp domain-containing protein [Myxococcota bacterium]|jgi:D-alanine-D-alanine ligase
MPRRIAVLTSDDATLAHGVDDDALAVAGVREVARHVEEACLALGWSVARVGVTRDPQRLLADLDRARPDVAFHLAESVGGDARMEASVAMLLDWIGLPYTGSPPLALAHALDKPVARALLAAQGVPVAGGAVLARGDESLAGLSPPWIVKPAREDASHGIHLESVVADEAAARRLARALIGQYRQPALVEEFIEGRELSVSLIGPAQEPTPLPIFEIDYSGFPAGRPKLVTYAAKWHPGSDEYRGTPLVPARDLGPALARRVIETGCAAWRALDLRGYGRVDLRLTGEGGMIVVDVNPNPDLAPHHEMALAAARAGIDYTSLIGWLVDQALGKPGGPAISRED